jgi:hypothetical protein
MSGGGLRDDPLPQFGGDLLGWHGCDFRPARRREKV